MVGAIPPSSRTGYPGTDEAGRKQRRREMLNRHNLELEKFLGNEERYSISHIKVTKDATVATNGKVLVEVTRPKVDKEDFPIIKGHEQKEDRDFYLTEEETRKVLKNIPKKVSLPILTNVAVSQEKEKTNLMMTDLDNDVVISSRNKEEVNYPKFDEVYPKNDAIACVKLSARHLRDICDKAIKFIEANPKLETEPLTLKFYGEEEPLGFSAENTETEQKMKGLIMPIVK